MAALRSAPFRHGPLRARPACRRGGFTLVELLVTMVVLLILVLLMVAITNQTSRVWRSSRTRIDAFQTARNAFERISAHLSQATLNTYLDYYNSTGQSRTDLLRSSPMATFTAATYDRASDLQFVCGQAAVLVPPATTNGRPTHAMFFQAPLGYVSASATAASDFKALNSVLNGVGYYIDFSDNSSLRPGFISTATPIWRYRLMELYQPSQNLSIYSSSTASTYTGVEAWFNLAVNPPQTSGSTSAAPTIITADNVVALIVRPETAAAAASVNSGSTATEVAPAYTYDTKAYLSQTDTFSKQSKNQLPPLVQVTMVAVDADSATRLAAMYGTMPPPLYAQSPFTDATQYTNDLSALTNVLQGYHLNYRVFTADVSVLGAQWSQSQSQ